MRRIALLAAVFAALGAALAPPGTGRAAPGQVAVGNLVLTADGGFGPTTLPRRRRAPIHFRGYARVRTRDGTLPPALTRARIDFDSDGAIDPVGLPVCRPARLRAAGTAQAKRRCGRALVGGGSVSAAVGLPGLRVKLTSPLLLFNGPRVDGDPTVIAHARAGAPVFETYVVVAPIERLRNPLFGYRVSFDVPEIAGGAGVLTDVNLRVGRRFPFRGKRRSYVSARCSRSYFQTQGFFAFDDGNVVSGSVFTPCNPR